MAASYIYEHERKRMVNDLTCYHCRRRIEGHAWVTRGEVLLHHACKQAFERAMRGLRYQCPQCETKGTVATGETRAVERRVPIVGTPSCAYNGCMGCGECSSMTRVETVEESITGPCPLCNGEGYLTQEPEAITETVVTGWCVVYEVPLVLQSGAELLAGVVWSPATSAIVTVYGHDAGGIDGPSLEAATLRDLALALDAERARMREALGVLRRGDHGQARRLLEAAVGKP